MPSKRKGIVLAGGYGTRLYPLTVAINKQLLPVYDKPMIYYPISVLMLAGIREILIIALPGDIPKYKNLLGDGSQYGINISYAEQKYPNGLAEALIIGEDFIAGDSVALVLGDNIFYGNDLQNILKSTNQKQEGATVFGYYVEKPQRFGVVEFDEKGKVLSITEKPKNPKSNYAIIGLYFYDNKAVEYAKSLNFSNRGELEITDLNKKYLDKGELDVKLLGRGFSWFDTGTIDALSDASEFIRIIQKRQSMIISALEEIGYNNNWITKEELLKAAKKYIKTPYGKYLEKVAHGDIINSQF
ncbi:glucose-1-phosphate thymidylyltransferase RfbA [Clostridiaceae bacterium M8S5]|nr:glucose-1-phosphate thymidylyltransferase RfbA [Clostridiaceae bacterium M8S5]